MHDILKRHVTGLALAAGLVLAPSVLWAQDTADLDGTDSELDEVVEDELESSEVDDKRWAVSATLATRAYQGMFAELQNQDPSLNGPGASDPSDAFDRWMNMYVLSGSYSLNDDFSFGAEVLWSHWMTRGGGSNGPYEIRFRDTTLRANWSGYNIDAIDTKISARYSLGLPTSKASRTAGMIASHGAGVSLSRTFFDKLSLRYSLGGSWGWHQSDGPTAPENIVQIYRTEERLGPDIRLAGRNTQFGLSNAFSASIPVWDKLRASISYSYRHNWSYNADNDDEYRNPNAKAGRANSDMTSGSVSLSYAFSKHLNLSGGVSTTQMPKTADNRSFRFPFWNFEGDTPSAANSSAFQLSVTGTY